MDGTLLNKKYRLEERVTALEEGGGGGLPDYSTTEQLTGQKWIDGKDIYFKVINTAVAIELLDTWYNTGLTGIDNVINYFPRMTRDGEEIGDTFNDGHLDYVVRNNELLVKAHGFVLTDSYAIATQVVYYTKVEVTSKKRSAKKKVEE